MPVVFEKLAAQLRDPPFRTSESGYDPDEVRAVLDEAAARLAVLEARVAKAEARAEKAQQRLARARRFAGSGKVAIAATDVLDDVVRDGQHRADMIVAEAHAEVDRVRRESTAAAAAARAGAEEPELRLQVDDQRRELRRQLEECHQAEANLDAVDRAVASQRDALLAGLELDLRELKEAYA